MTDRKIPLKRPTTLSLDKPAFEPEVFRTGEGVPYFKEAGVAMIARTDFDPDALQGFLESWEPSLGFMDYLLDEPTDDEPASLCKFAGQLCYLSMGPKRTKNADAAKYLDRIKEQGHGSVLEHASYSFVLWGIDRATTHEIVRHRAGFAYSQVSQRYCGGPTLRFVERPEYQPERLAVDANPSLRAAVRRTHDRFERSINNAFIDYVNDGDRLKEAQYAGHPMLQSVGPTDDRKRFNQTVREALPNCTEAPIVVTGNARAWRGFVDQRATEHADAPIRELAVKVLRCLEYVSPLLFGDYHIMGLDDGSECAGSIWRKV